MKLHDLLRSSMQSLDRTRARSALTMLGIVIGIMSVILMLSVGEAAQRYILGQISAFGSDILTIANGPKVTEGQPSLFIKQSLTVRDLRRLRSAPWVAAVSGRYSQQERISVNGYDTNVTVVGTTPEELIFQDVRVAYGVFFDTTAVDGYSREAVIGHDIAVNAFGADEPVGRSIKLNEQTFRIVGVMMQSGTKGFQNVDTQIYVPVTSALNLYNAKYLSNISVKSHLPIAETKEQIEYFIRDTHNIDNPEGDLAKDDFNVSSQDDAIASASTITDILQILLVSIAAISLLVGGIGIMNIMYVSVTERIKEIGLRKAIGAKRRDILGQFLTEAVMLTSVGGLYGIALGIGLSWIGIQLISSFQSGWTFAISWSGVVLGLVVSAAIGIIFGYFPARRAASLSPIEALRTE